ncbi:hypothetical protein BX600DRAFT_477790 [Xylariales sp. PMI_506]|nr:hypothetical protein BX600DRAFT_477790 [Xylariales sp. PMI_506]
MSLIILAVGSRARESATYVPSAASRLPPTTSSIGTINLRAVPLSKGIPSGSRCIAIPTPPKA